MGYRGERAQLEARVEAQRADLEELRERLDDAAEQLSRAPLFEAWRLRFAVNRARHSAEATADHDGTVTGLRVAVETNEHTLLRGRRVLRRLDESLELSTRQEWFADLGARARTLGPRFRVLAVVVAGLCVWAVVAPLWALGALDRLPESSGGVLLVAAALVVMGGARFLSFAFRQLFGVESEATVQARRQRDARLGLATVMSAGAFLASGGIGLWWWLR